MIIESYQYYVTVPLAASVSPRLEARSFALGKVHIDFRGPATYHSAEWHDCQ